MTTIIDTKVEKQLTADQLDQLALTPIVDTLAFDRLRCALASRPFLLVSSFFEKDEVPVACMNFRNAWSDERTPEIRHDVLYRAGKSAFRGSELKRLGISRVYDLRSDVERQRDPHDDRHMDDVEVVWIEPTTILSHFLQRQAQETDAEEYASTLLIDSYMRILTSHQAVFRQLLLDLSSSSHAILLHCTAGKDRTGVATAMLLSLAGCSDEGIAREYALTRIGIEPARERLTKVLQATVGRRQGAPTTMDQVALRALSESKSEDMLGFLQRVRETYGSFEGYALAHLHLKKDQINAVRQALQRRV